MLVHRIRCVPVDVSAPTKLAIQPDIGGSPPEWRGVVAVGRENGTIGLLEWHQDHHVTLKACYFEVQQIAATASSSRSSNTIEDLVCAPYYPSQKSSYFAAKAANLHRVAHLISIGGANNRVIFHSPLGNAERMSQGGAIWSITASTDGHWLALGSADGQVRLVDISVDALASPGLLIIRTIPIVSSDVSILSLAFGFLETKMAEDDQDAALIPLLACGTGQSSVIIIEPRTSSTRKIKLDKAAAETLVWDVKFNNSREVIVADSTGAVSIYDSNNATRKAYFASTHDADVLALALGADGQTFYTASVDHRVSQFSKTQIQYKHVATRTLHTSDVRALVFSPGEMPLIISAGADHHVVLTLAALNDSDMPDDIVNPISSSHSMRFVDSYQRRLPFLPPSPNNVLLRSNHIFAYGSQQVSIYMVTELNSITESTIHAPQKVLEMQLALKGSLTAFDVSQDTSYLCIADFSGIKIFSLLRNGKFAPQKLPTQALHFSSVSACAFLPDGVRLCVAHGAQVSVVDASKQTVTETLSTHLDNEPSSDLLILQLAISPDGAWLASLDNRGSICLTSLDSFRLHCRIAKQNQICCMIIDPTSHNLILCSHFNDVSIYNIESKTFLPFITPQLLKQQLDRALGFAHVDEKLLLWASTWIGSLDISTATAGNSRKHQIARTDFQSPNDKRFAMTNCYRSIAAVAKLTDGQICVLERPSVDQHGNSP